MMIATDDILNMPPEKIGQNTHIKLVPVVETFFEKKIT